ncbi:ERAD-associated E3 ubiquitin-protein ligase HRD1, putative [Babesia caballi]|uniref:RING-type E3 ubiquitin transferase n=1 Tax=Babesia caballi TaxID=5871 RepID=A0AAV4LSQ1_BABCB|nr:ERAD-associated E3 ubiquitin-protein ligase HRD1, putative [Babesia caballi]
MTETRDDIWERYVIVSHLLLACSIGHVSLQTGGFYEMVIHFMNNKTCIAILYNYLFMLFTFGCQIPVYLFLGQLSQLETEQLQETARNYLLDAVLFVVFSKPRLNGREIPVAIVLKYLTTLVALKCFHTLLYTRLSNTFQMDVPSYLSIMRLSGLIYALSMTDCYLINSLSRDLNWSNTFTLWVIFEIFGMALVCLFCMLRYLVNMLDFFYDSGLKNKTTVMFFLELAHDLLSLCCFGAFMFIFYLHNPGHMPAYMLLDILHVFKNISDRCQMLMQYRRVVKSLEQRYPRPTEAEKERDGSCIICREEFNDASRRIDCGHVFHLSCLKSWLFQHSTCPTCRAPIEEHEASHAEDFDISQILVYLERPVRRAYRRARRWVMRLLGRVDPPKAPEFDAESIRRYIVRCTKQVANPILDELNDRSVVCEFTLSDFLSPDSADSATKGSSSDADAKGDKPVTVSNETRAETKPTVEDAQRQVDKTSTAVDPPETTAEPAPGSTVTEVISQEPQDNEARSERFNKPEATIDTASPPAKDEPTQPPGPAQPQDGTVSRGSSGRFTGRFKRGFFRNLFRRRSSRLADDLTEGRVAETVASALLAEQAPEGEAACEPNGTAQSGSHGDAPQNVPDSATELKDPVSSTTTAPSSEGAPAESTSVTTRAPQEPPTQPSDASPSPPEITAEAPPAAEDTADQPAEPSATAETVRRSLHLPVWLRESCRRGSDPETKVKVGMLKLLNKLKALNEHLSSVSRGQGNAGTGASATPPAAAAGEPTTGGTDSPGHSSTVVRRDASNENTTAIDAPTSRDAGASGGSTAAGPSSAKDGNPAAGKPPASGGGAVKPSDDDLRAIRLLRIAKLSKGSEDVADAATVKAATPFTQGGKASVSDHSDDIESLRGDFTPDASPPARAAGQDVSAGNRCRVDMMDENGDAATSVRLDPYTQSAAQANRQTDAAPTSTEQYVLNADGEAVLAVEQVTSQDLSPAAAVPIVTLNEEAEPKPGGPATDSGTASPAISVEKCSSTTDGQEVLPSHISEQDSSTQRLVAVEVRDAPDSSPTPDDGPTPRTSVTTQNFVSSVANITSSDLWGLSGLITATSRTPGSDSEADGPAQRARTILNDANMINNLIRDLQHLSVYLDCDILLSADSAADDRLLARFASSPLPEHTRDLYLTYCKMLRMWLLTAKGLSDSDPLCRTAFETANQLRLVTATSDRQRDLIRGVYSSIECPRISSLRVRQLHREFLRRSFSYQDGLWRLQGSTVSVDIVEDMVRSMSLVDAIIKSELERSTAHTTKTAHPPLSTRTPPRRNVGHRAAATGCTSLRRRPGSQGRRSRFTNAVTSGLFWPPIRARKMADYHDQFVNAALTEDPRTPSEINKRNAAALYEIFQRVGALDIYFGLQQDLRRHEYPLSRGAAPPPGRAGNSQPPAWRHRNLSQESLPPISNDSATRPVQKEFTVDKIYRSRLMNRQQSSGDVSAAGDGPGATDTPPDALSEEPRITASSTQHALLTPEDPANGSVAPEPETADHGGSSASGNVAHPASDKAASEAPLWDNPQRYSIETNISKTTLNEANSTGGAGRPAGPRKMAPTSGHTTESKAGAHTRTSASADKHDGHSEWIENNGTLIFAESLDISALHQFSSRFGLQTPQSDKECRLIPACINNTLPASSQTLQCARRLRLYVWFREWLLPNLSAALSCVRSTVVECSDGMMREITPPRIDRAARRFDQVFLSSLEYAILKDDLTRCYFHIADDRKEHLMLRELDDFRRLNLRKRISFDEFCLHFGPYLSRRPEDYTRNKGTDSTEDALQRRALQRVLEKSIYGLSVDRPNEFFNKGCTLKPFQVLEPIPHK